MNLKIFFIIFLSTTHAGRISRRRRRRNQYNSKAIIETSKQLKIMNNYNTEYLEQKCGKNIYKNIEFMVPENSTSYCYKCKQILLHPYYCGCFVEIACAKVLYLRKKMQCTKN
jgi:hypothetical protein